MLNTSAEKQEAMQIVNEVLESESKATKRSGRLKDGMNRKAQLSAYFIIAAAAFGLISDGCECPTCRSGVSPFARAGAMLV